MLDEVAWLFNLRGSDIDFNPGARLSRLQDQPRLRLDFLTQMMIVFFAYAVITMDKALLFVNLSQVNDSVRAHLGTAVEIQSYDSFFSYLKELGAEVGLFEESVIVIPLSCSRALNLIMHRNPTEFFSM